MITEFMANYPVIGITIVSFVITLIVTLIYKYMTDQAALKQVRDEIKALKDEMKQYKNDPQKTMEINKKLMEKSFEPMKHTMKPMLISFLPIILIFAWLRDSVPATEAIINLPFSIPKAGINTGIGWFGVYFVTALIFNSVLRKVLKVY